MILSAITIFGPK